MIPKQESKWSKQSVFTILSQCYEYCRINDSLNFFTVKEHDRLCIVDKNVCFFFSFLFFFFFFFKK